MRVLLFTRRIVSTPSFPDGDDSPKCVKSFGGDVARGLVYLAKIQFGSWGDGSGRPDAAWLVEAENAMLGRAIIAHHDPGGFGQSVVGRIIATGGKP